MTSNYIFNELDDLINTYYDRENGPGGVILILKEDKIIYESSLGLCNIEDKKKNMLQTQFRLASITKQFTAMCIFLLIDNGLLRYETTIGEIFKDLPESIQNITIIQLLNHTSGIWDYEDLINESHKNQIKDEDVLNLIKNKNETYFTPGSKFRYSNTGYCILSLIIEKVSGKSFSEYIKQNIFNLLNINDAIVYDDNIDINNRAYGYHKESISENLYKYADQSITSATKGDGGIYISANEYSKWLSSLFIRNCFPKTSTMNYLDKIKENKANIDDFINYGLGWFYCKEKDGSMSLFHSGESTGFHNIVYTNIDKKLSIIIFNNNDDMKTISNVFDKIQSILNINLPLKNEKSLFKWMNRVYLSMI